jgi:hypothetical protein
VRPERRGIAGAVRVGFLRRVNNSTKVNRVRRVSIECKNGLSLSSYGSSLGDTAEQIPRNTQLPNSTNVTHPTTRTRITRKIAGVIDQYSYLTQPVPRCLHHALLHLNLQGNSNEVDQGQRRPLTTNTQRLIGTCDTSNCIEFGLVTNSSGVNRRKAAQK